MKFLKGMLQKYEIVKEGISWFQQKSMSINSDDIDPKAVLAFIGKSPDRSEALGGTKGRAVLTRIVF